jgi:hypothetical protein
MVGRGQDHVYVRARLTFRIRSMSDVGKRFNWTSE